MKLVRLAVLARFGPVRWGKRGGRAEGKEGKKDRPRLKVSLTPVRRWSTSMSPHLVHATAENHRARPLPFVSSLPLSFSASVGTVGPSFPAGRVCERVHASDVTPVIQPGCSTWPVTKCQCPRSASRKFLFFFLFSFFFLFACVYVWAACPLSDKTIDAKGRPVMYSVPDTDAMESEIPFAGDGSVREGIARVRGTNAVELLTHAGILLELWNHDSDLEFAGANLEIHAVVTATRWKIWILTSVDYLEL